MTDNSALAACIRQQLATHAQPARAGAMQAYMKSALPFFGVNAPQRRLLVKAALAQHPLADGAALEHQVLSLWRPATHREERYAALDLLRVARHRRWISAARLPLLEELLRTGTWWDFNDEISGLALGLLLQREPDLMKPLLRQWARGDDLWLRRAAMLCQRSIKTGFDAVLLYDTLLPSLGSHPLAREFFIRKGMGWALRERSYQAPEEVQAFCDAYAAQMSPLTRREALKVIAKRRGAL